MVYARLFGELNGMYGKHHTSEAIEKIGQASKGRMLGKHLSLETREKIRLKALGRKPSMEARIKMRLSGIRRWSTNGSRQEMSEINRNFYRSHPEALERMSQTTRKLWEEGKTYTEETKRKIGDALRGIPRSEEVKEKISKSRVGMRHSEETKNKISESLKGKFHSEETKKKIGDAQRREKNHAWRGGKMEKVCLSCGKRYFVEKSLFGESKYCSRRCVGIQNNLKQSKGKDTRIERILEGWLKENGIEYEKQKPLFGRTIVDFFVEPNICIYADGDYWHKIPKTVKRDKRITELLKDKGYTVYRLWEHEIKEGIRPPIYIR